MRCANLCSRKVALSAGACARAQVGKQASAAVEEKYTHRHYNKANSKMLQFVLYSQRSYFYIMSNKAITVEAKHIFLDIVNYTHERSIEAQTELIAVLNRIVKNSVRKNKIRPENILYIPTGDGMCISIINISMPFDIHLLISLDILVHLQIHNNSIEDEMRKFSLRIGINENTDNLIIDINNQKNISGSGINFASRKLSLCDTNQILVSSVVFDKIVQREKYLKSFHRYNGEVKHGIQLSVFQYRNEEYTFLNNNTPSSFISATKTTPKLTKLFGYYIANCILLESFIVKNLHHPQSQYSLVCLLFHLAEDSLAKSKATKTNPRPTKKTKRPIQEEFDYFQSTDFWLLADLDTFIRKTLSDISEYFTDGFLFVNDKGRFKLIEDQPIICDEFEITK